jgi:glyoxylase-like metal-dependent hydrolase (beta-lactamase superfamily II)
MAKTGIGANVTQVQKVFSKIFNYNTTTDDGEENENDLKTDGSQFDILFNDGDTFPLGDLEVRVLYTPGHTPACVCYVVGKDAVFTGDTIFMPDFGTGKKRRQLYVVLYI